MGAWPSGVLASESTIAMTGPQAKVGVLLPPYICCFAVRCAFASAYKRCPRLFTFMCRLVSEQCMQHEAHLWCPSSRRNKVCIQGAQSGLAWLMLAIGMRTRVMHPFCFGRKGSRTQIRFSIAWYHSLKNMQMWRCVLKMFGPRDRANAQQKDSVLHMS